MESAKPDDLLETHSDPFKSRCALLVSLLAMVLALASLGGSNASKEATMHNILASNAYAFYQAKNIRQTSYKLAADDFQFILAQEKLSPATRELVEGKLQSYKKNIERYESEPDTKEGKKELMAKARNLENDRAVAKSRSPWYTYAGSLFQIAIVLLTASILAVNNRLYHASIGVGALGALLMSQAIWLWLPIVL